MKPLNWVTCLAIGLTCAVVGCDKQAGYKPAEQAKKESPKKHDHGTKGPHNGGLVELGDDEYHAEIVVEHDSHSIDIYILGKDAKTAVPVTQTEITLTPEGKEALTLKAAPQAGEGDGKSSKFHLEDDKIVHDIIEAGFLHGDLRVTVGETNFVGHVDHHLDGKEHDHDHDHPEKKAEEKKPAESK